MPARFRRPPIRGPETMLSSKEFRARNCEAGKSWTHTSPVVQTMLRRRACPRASPGMRGAQDTLRSSSVIVRRCRALLPLPLRFPVILFLLLLTVLALVTVVGNCHAVLRCPGPVGAVGCVVNSVVESSTEAGSSSSGARPWTLMGKYATLLFGASAG